MLNVDLKIHLKEKLDFFEDSSRPRDCFHAPTLRRSSRSSVRSTPVPCSVGEVHIFFYLQALIYDQSAQNLEVELFDEDTDKDDFLGRYGLCYKHMSASYNL